MPKPKDVEALTQAAKSPNKDNVDFSASKRITLTGSAKMESQKKTIEELKTTTIWTHVVPVNLDYKRLEDLFENKVAEVKILVNWFDG